MLDFLLDYGLPDILPQELHLLILEFSSHVKRGSKSISYVLYF